MHHHHPPPHVHHPPPHFHHPPPPPHVVHHYGSPGSVAAAAMFGAAATVAAAAILAPPKVYCPPPPPKVVYTQPKVVVVQPPPVYVSPTPVMQPMPMMTPMPVYSPVLPGSLSPGSQVCLQSMVHQRELRVMDSGYIDFNGCGGPYTHFNVYFEGPFVRFQSAHLPHMWLRLNPVTQTVDATGTPHGPESLFTVISHGNNVYSFSPNMLPGVYAGTHDDGRPRSAWESNMICPYTQFFIRAPH
ncbi:hypothetical protein Pelo_10167 [Pelomyxa schiedti]|nr:hypothetical protein Pelo_10167 [Pelomyxa schiedti]